MRNGSVDHDVARGESMRDDRRPQAVHSGHHCVGSWRNERMACIEKGAECAASLEEASRNPIVRAEVERAVNKANELASRAESIRKFEIVPDEFTEENGLVTPSLKARRQAVVDHYRMLIDTVIYVPKK